MLGIDSEIGTSALRLWVAAGSAALLVVVCAFALGGARAVSLGPIGRSGALVLAALLGAAMGWAFLSAPGGDQSAERQALEMRAAALDTQALAPGSPLACLDGTAGEAVEAACEKALFATPASVAAAVSYSAARLALLADMAAYGQRGGAEIGALQPVRHALETDRFGFVAHLLAMRGCSGQDCKAFALFHDASRLRANLNEQTFARYLDHYTAVWAQPPEPAPVAEAGRATSLASGEPGQLAAPGQRKALVNIDFPTAASIPAVSIMNPEPKGPVVPGAAAAAAVAGNPNAPAPAAQPATQSARRARKQAPPPQPEPQAPEQAPVEPVWMPATPPISPAAPIGAPVQLSPGGSSPGEASAGTTRSQ